MCSDLFFPDVAAAIGLLAVWRYDNPKPKKVLSARPAGFHAKERSGRRLRKGSQKQISSLSALRMDGIVDTAQVVVLARRKLDVAESLSCWYAVSHAAEIWFWKQKIESPTRCCILPSALNSATLPLHLSLPIPSDKTKRSILLR